MYVHTYFDTYSDRHVFGLLLCAGGIALCFAVLAVQRLTYSYMLLRYCCLLLHTYRSRTFVAVQKTMENEDCSIKCSRRYMLALANAVCLLALSSGMYEKESTAKHGTAWHSTAEHGTARRARHRTAPHGAAALSYS